MINKSVGFIGGGRITRVILGGFKKKGEMPIQAVVSDTSIAVLGKLKEQFPEVDIVLNDNKKPALQDIIFLAIHPPAVTSVLSYIKSCLKPASILISMVPKITIAKLSENLGGFNRIVRMIPNACTIVNKGYNPLTFSDTLTEPEKKWVVKMLSVLGNCPIVAEENLECYAILTAMGPTYLWFQLYELQKISESFGLTPKEVEDGILKMTTGAVATMYKSGLAPEEVMDLVPLKPLGEEEDNIKNVYNTKLTALFKKLKG